MNDAIVLGANALAAEQVPSRVLIVLTDGNDISSKANAATAIAAARRAGVPVYTIAIKGEHFDLAALQRLARRTGGTYYTAATTAALGSVYSKVAAELARTWQLDYVTAARPGQKFELTATSAGSGSGKLSLTVPGSDGSKPKKHSALLPAFALRAPGERSPSA